MATFYTAETTGLASTPLVKTGSQAYDKGVSVYQATINLATVNGGTAVGTSDNVLLAKVPAGYKFLYGTLTSGVTLGSSVVAIGTNGTHASNGQYRAAAVSTAVDTPAVFALAAAQSAVATTVTTDIYLTVATAALPTSGTVVIQLFYAKV